MNIRELHVKEKGVSTALFFKGELGTNTAIRILKGELFKEHITKIPAFLICVEGKAIFENEKKERQTLLAGDYVKIDPMVKH